MDKTVHAALNQAFTAEAQKALLDEDSHAWVAVTGILFTIVTAGAILGIIGVLLALS